MARVDADLNSISQDAGTMQRVFTKGPLCAMHGL